jgi:hypothetical protein
VDDTIGKYKFTQENEENLDNITTHRTKTRSQSCYRTTPDREETCQVIQEVLYTSHAVKNHGVMTIGYSVRKKIHRYLPFTIYINITNLK